MVVFCEAGWGGLLLCAAKGSTRRVRCEPSAVTGMALCPPLALSGHRTRRNVRFLG